MNTIRFSTLSLLFLAGCGVHETVYIEVPAESAKKEPVVSTQSIPTTEPTTSDRGTVRGLIENKTFELGSAFAYVLASDGDRLNVELFPKGGPSGCEIKEGRVTYIFANGETPFGVGASIYLMRTKERQLPWDGGTVALKSTRENFAQFEVARASDTVFQINDVTDSVVRGAVKAETNLGSIAGTFTAKICKNSKIPR